jgi:hypothetical protein
MPLIRRRPLLRAAAIGGGAYMAGRRQTASRQPLPEPVAEPPDAPDPIAQLTQLGRLRDQ